MKCPLLGRYVDVAEKPYKSGQRDCLMGECAWYDEAEAECAILSLTTWLPIILSLLRSMKKELPQ